MCKAKTCDDCQYDRQQMQHEHEERQRQDGDEAPDWSDEKIAKLVDTTNEADRYLKFLQSGGNPLDYNK